MLPSSARRMSPIRYVQLRKLKYYDVSQFIKIDSILEVITEKLEAKLTIDRM